VDNPPAVSPSGFFFFSKPSEKHSCFSEGLLKKKTMAEKDLKINSVPSEFSVV
jgi:hypothetical protein